MALNIFLGAGDVQGPVRIPSSLAIGANTSVNVPHTLAVNLDPDVPLVVNKDGTVNLRLKNGLSDIFVNGMSLATQIGAASLSDYSAVEVHPTNEDMAAGTVDTETGIAYNVSVPAQMTACFRIRSMHPLARQNVVVDWGDGTIFDLASMTSRNTAYTDSVLGDPLNSPDGVYDPGLDTDGETNIELAHRYAEPGRYIVKILGNTYWGFRFGQFAKYNLVSRIWDSDLPVASCVMDMATCAGGSLRLQQVCIPNYYNLQNIINASGAFQNCKNLKYAVGFSGDFSSIINGVDSDKVNWSMNNKLIFRGSVYAAQNMFLNCSGLELCDCTLPKSTTNLAAGRPTMFKGCSSLRTDVLKLIPDGGFSDHIVNLTEAFSGCLNLRCSNFDRLAERLWGDTSVKWTSGKCFYNCTNLFNTEGCNIPDNWRNA